MKKQSAESNLEALLARHDKNCETLKSVFSVYFDDEPKHPVEDRLAASQMALEFEKQLRAN